MAHIHEATHCITCGDELSEMELYPENGHCDRCKLEACEDYFSKERQEYETT